MRSWLSGFLSALAIAACMISPAAAQRVALVIGNSDYKNASVLKNPVNDAADLGSALSRLGFTVTTLTNASAGDMQRALTDFAGKAKDSEMALIFFAGHAVEAEGVHWSIPVDGKVDSLDAVRSQSVNLQQLMKTSEGSKFTIVLLDSARDNPFPQNSQRAPAQGAEVPPGRNVLVAFSTKAGDRPLDGEGRNSPFVAALLKHMETPGLDLRLLMGRVRDEVSSATQRKQSPFTYGSLPGGGFSFAPR